MSKEILLTSNYTLNFTHHNVNHYIDACKEFGFTARVLNSFDMYKETQLPYGAINMAGYPNETHLRFTRKLEIHGVKVVNPVYSAMIADDKALSNLEMSKLNLAVPKTLDLHVSSFDRAIPTYVREEIGFPCVIKVPRMGYGMGIYLARTEEDFINMFDLMSICSSKSANYISNTNLVVQEFIPETQGRQIKVFVLNKQVIASYYYENLASWKIGRTGPVDVPRTDNVAGGNVIFELTQIDSDLEEKCINICESFNLNFACIDVFFGRDGFLFNEINTTPGFHRCYPSVPVAHLVMEYLIKSSIP